MNQTLTETERLRIELWEAQQREIVRAHEDHAAALSPILRKIEKRLKLPAGSVGTTHEVRDWVVGPVAQGDTNE